MLLITDGVYEARSPEGDQLGIERVLQIVRERIDRPKEEIIRSLHAEIRQFTGSGELLDDVTVVLAEATRDLTKTRPPGRTIQEAECALGEVSVPKDGLGETQGAGGVRQSNLKLDLTPCPARSDPKPRKNAMIGERRWFSWQP